MKKLFLFIFVFITLISNVYAEDKTDLIKNARSGVLMDSSSGKILFEKDKNLKIEEIITQVNIGLDKPFYEEVKKIKVAQTKYVLVNKYNYLDKEYTPDNLVNLGRIRLVKCAADAFTELVNAAKEEDYFIRSVFEKR